MVTSFNSQLLLKLKKNEPSHLSLESSTESQSKVNSAKTILNPPSQLNFVSNLSTTININAKTDRLFSINRFTPKEVSTNYHLNAKRALQSPIANNEKLRNFLLSCRFNDIEPEIFNRNIVPEQKNKFISCDSRGIYNRYNSSDFCELLNTNTNKRQNNHKKLFYSKSKIDLPKYRIKSPFVVGNNKNDKFDVVSQNHSPNANNKNYNLNGMNNISSIIFQEKMNHLNMNRAFIKKNLMHSNNLNKKKLLNSSRNNLCLSNSCNEKLLSRDNNTQSSQKNKRLLSFLETQIKDKLFSLQQKKNIKMTSLKKRYFNINQSSIHLKKYHFQSYLRNNNNNIINTTNRASDYIFYITSLNSNTNANIINCFAYDHTRKCILPNQIIRYLLQLYLEISHLYISEILFNSRDFKEATPSYRKNKSSYNVKFSLYNNDSKNLIFPQNFIFLDYPDSINNPPNKTNLSPETLFDSKRKYNKSKTQRNKLNKQLSLHPKANINLLKHPSFFNTRRKKKNDDDNRLFGDIIGKTTKEIIDDIHYLIYSNFKEKQVDWKNKANYFIFHLLKRFITGSDFGKFKTHHSLYSKFFSLDTIDNDGNTLLILAVKMNIKDIVEYILAQGVNVDVQNLSGNTALHYAVASKYFEIINTLNCYGAKESIQNNEHKTVWDCLGLYYTKEINR